MQRTAQQEDGQQSGAQQVRLSVNSLDGPSASRLQFAIHSSWWSGGTAPAACSACLGAVLLDFVDRLHVVVVERQHNLLRPAGRRNGRQGKGRVSAACTAHGDTAAGGFGYWSEAAACQRALHTPRWWERAARSLPGCMHTAPGDPPDQKLCVGDGLLLLLIQQVLNLLLHHRPQPAKRLEVNVHLQRRASHSRSDTLTL